MQKKTKLFIRKILTKKTLLNKVETIFLDKKNFNKVETIFAKNSTLQNFSSFNDNEIDLNVFFDAKKNLLNRQNPTLKKFIYLKSPEVEFTKNSSKFLIKSKNLLKDLDRLFFKNVIHLYKEFLLWYLKLTPEILLNPIKVPSQRL